MNGKRAEKQLRRDVTLRIGPKRQDSHKELMYSLEALLARLPTLEGALEIFPSAAVIHLPQGIGMIPTDGFLLRELEIYYQGGTKVTQPNIQKFSPPIHPGFERLIVGIEQLAQHLSHRGTIAYVEAFFTGGCGGHATMIWANGKRAGCAGDNINDVLRLLGVVPQPGFDEFDTLGLGRHRSTREWLAPTTPPSGSVDGRSGD